MRVIVTRPIHEAQQWIQALRAAGHEAVALPLIAIGPAPDPAAVAAAWSALDRYRSVMFVSAQAVQRFFAQRPAQATTFPCEAWATGPGTARALRIAGVPAAQVIAPAADAAQFDSEALWQCVASALRAGERVLIVRGADADTPWATGTGRDWLAQKLRAAALEVDFVASYQRQRPTLDARARQLASSAATDGSWWLFSSSEAIHNLRTALPAQNWQTARALTTHPRIAQAARDAGFGQVHTTRPTLEAIRASIECPQ